LDIGLNYRFHSNISQTITCYAYDWDDPSWVVLTETSPTTETAYVHYDLGVEYFQDDVDDLLFRFKIYGTNSSNYTTSFDLLTLEIEYDNHNDPTYDTYHELESVFEWDFTDIGTFLTDRTDITGIEIDYSYFTNITQHMSVYAWDWTNSEWDILSNATHTVLTLITNTTLTYDYFKDDTTDLLFKIKFFSSLIVEDTVVGTPFDCESDLVTLNITFTNRSDSYYTYTEALSSIINPFTYRLDGLSDGTYTVFYYDLYDNDMGNRTFTQTIYTNLNYTESEMRECLISYSDQQGNYLNFFKYKTKINGTTIYEQYFYRELGDIMNISVFDRFDNYITESLYTITRDDNWVSIIITIHSLKIYNQQDSFAYFNLSSTVSTAYWSEWIAPDEIVEFKLIAGDYRLNVTKYEETTITTLYNYTLVGDDILLINSQYTLLLLSKIQQMSVFSDLTNWDDVYDDLTQIALYDFVNSFSEQNVKVYLRYEGTTDSIIVGAGDIVSQILPTNMTSDVDYRVKNIETDEYLTEWTALPENKTVDIGFFDTTVPATPDDLKPTNVSVWTISLLSVAIIVVLGYLYLKNKSQNTAKKSINRKLFMDEETINHNIKKSKRRGGFYNLKGTMD